MAHHTVLWLLCGHFMLCSPWHLNYALVLSVSLCSCHTANFLPMVLCLSTLHFVCALIGETVSSHPWICVSLIQWFCCIADVLRCSDWKWHGAAGRCEKMIWSRKAWEIDFSVNVSSVFAAWMLRLTHAHFQVRCCACVWLCFLHSQLLDNKDNKKLFFFFCQTAFFGSRPLHWHSSVSTCLS